MFEIIYFIEFLLISVVRSSQTRHYRRETVVVNRKTTPDIFMLALAGVAMLMPLVYIFSPWFDFANYMLPGWLGWVGSMLFALGIWLLWRSHVDLGRNWTPTPGIRDDHQLVTDGVFRYIRHPMYAAHILWGLAAALMLPNWLAGAGPLLVFIAQYLTRVGLEERMMLEQFGAAYERYMQRTGRIFPRLLYNQRQ
jgi:protein-S-isoprenylcysteine O-methyltransferase Ste14